MVFILDCVLYLHHETLGGNRVITNYSVKHNHPFLLQLEEHRNGTNRGIYWNLGKWNKHLWSISYVAESIKWRVGFSPLSWPTVPNEHSFMETSFILCTTHCARLWVERDEQNTQGHSHELTIGWKIVY